MKEKKIKIMYKLKQFEITQNGKIIVITCNTLSIFKSKYNQFFTIVYKL